MFLLFILRLLNIQLRKFDSLNSSLPTVGLIKFLRTTFKCPSEIKMLIASYVLRTSDFVRIVPEKANVCFAAASFFLEHDQFATLTMLWRTTNPL